MDVVGHGHSIRDPERGEHKMNRSTATQMIEDFDTAEMPPIAGREIKERYYSIDWTPRIWSWVGLSYWPQQYMAQYIEGYKLR